MTKTTITGAFDVAISLIAGYKPVKGDSDTAAEKAAKPTTVDKTEATAKSALILRSNDFSYGTCNFSIDPLTVQELRKSFQKYS